MPTSAHTVKGPASSRTATVRPGTRVPQRSEVPRRRALGERRHPVPEPPLGSHVRGERLAGRAVRAGPDPSVLRAGRSAARRGAARPAAQRREHHPLPVALLRPHTEAGDKTTDEVWLDASDRVVRLHSTLPTEDPLEFVANRVSIAPPEPGAATGACAQPEVLASGRSKARDSFTHSSLERRGSSASFWRRVWASSWRPVRTRYPTSSKELNR